MEPAGQLAGSPKSGSGQTVTFHDPVYLGRQRWVVALACCSWWVMSSRSTRNGTNSFCCGAGGARMWMEEHTGKKVNVERGSEAVATGSDVTATGCPFCFVMLDDGGERDRSRRAGQGLGDAAGGADVRLGTRGVAGQRGVAGRRLKRVSRFPAVSRVGRDELVESFGWSTPIRGFGVAGG